MISPKTWKIIKGKQDELDQLIYQRSQLNWTWCSLANVKRLKLNILVEIGEFANELKTFKIWRKKQHTDWEKAQVELIDCLCFFLGLSNLHQINFTSFQYSLLDGNQDFNDLLLQFFSQTEKLFILKNEKSYHQEKSIKLSLKQQQTYYDWLSIFSKLMQKLGIDEKKLLEVYLYKNEINQKRLKNLS